MCTSVGETSVGHLVVVIPACDEADTIGIAVAAVHASASVLPASVRVETLVVANGCSDRTAAAACETGAHVLVREAPNVGSARSAGCDWAIDRAGDLNRLWIASTDADSIVPVGWLAAQVAAAEQGADVFLGTVELLPADAHRHAAWLRRYVTRDAATVHGHVHGANLGVRAAAYSRAGGFRALPAHEDVDLVARLVEGGAVLAWVDDVPVLTSARHDARVVGGVGTDLAETAPDAREDMSNPSSVA